MLFFRVPCHIFTPDAFSSIYIVYIHRYTLYKVLGAHIRRLEPPIRRQWRPLAAIWKNSLLKAYIHRYTPYEVLGAHRRRLEPPIRRQWRPLAAIWKNSLLIAYIHRYTPYKVLSSASPTNFSRGI